MVSWAGGWGHFGVREGGRSGGGLEVFKWPVVCITLGV